jgi:ribulose-5-phosphate 4-epimerase/fuculose-1-phosphate aldolase
MPTLDDYRNDVANASQNLVKLGIMTKSNHGNVSLRLPGEDRFLLTSGGTLANMRTEDVALFDLEGKET